MACIFSCTFQWSKMFSSQNSFYIDTSPGQVTRWILEIQPGNHFKDLPLRTSLKIIGSIRLGWVISSVDQFSPGWVIPGQFFHRDGIHEGTWTNNQQSTHICVSEGAQAHASQFEWWRSNWFIAISMCVLFVLITMIVVMLLLRDGPVPYESKWWLVVSPICPPCILGNVFLLLYQNVCLTNTKKHVLYFTLYKYLLLGYIIYESKWWLFVDLSESWILTMRYRLGSMSSDQLNYADFLTLGFKEKFEFLTLVLHEFEGIVRKHIYFD